MQKGRKFFKMGFCLITVSWVFYLGIALANDNFDGVIIDTEKWEVAFKDGSTVAQNDALFVSHDGGVSAEWAYAPGLESFAPAAGVVSKWKLSGDFDIQVDFNQFSAAPVSYGQVFFNIFQDDMNALHIKRIRSSWQDGVQTVYIQGSSERHNSSVTSFSAPSGTFRIIREGNTITTFLNSSRYFSASEIFSGDVTVALTVAGPINETTAVAFDNFVINSGTIVPALGYPQGITAYWKFDEGSGNIVYDSVSNNHGDLINYPQWITGIVNNALIFNGSNYVDAGNNAEFNFGNGAENFTIEAWIYRTSPTTGGIVAKACEFPHDGWAFAVYADGRLSFSGVLVWEIVSSTKIPLNQWVHVTATRNGNIYKLYKDGTEIASKIREGYLETYSGNLTIGTDYTTSTFFDGKIDETAIYNRALTSLEINQHYQNGLRGIGYEIGVNPIAIAEPGLDENNQLILDGRRSYDPNGIIVSWNWNLNNRNPEGTDYVLTGETISTDSIVDIGVYDVTLTVTDDDEFTGADTIVFSVPADLSGCPKLQALINNLINLLDVASEDEIIYSVINLQSEVNNLSEQIVQLQAQLTTANETIGLQADTIAELEDELTLRQAELNEAKARIADLETTLSNGFTRIEADFQTVFNDPNFVIPGNTLLEKLDSLINAVLGINTGRKKGIYENLGGKVKQTSGK